MQESSSREVEPAALYVQSGWCDSAMGFHRGSHYFGQPIEKLRFI
jgi:hypothetical protein